MKYFIFCLLYIVAIAGGQTVDNVKAVVKHLFQERSYNKIVRPVVDQKQQLDIGIDFYLVSIDAFHEVSQRITTTAYLYITWVDIELMWDEMMYGGVSNLLLPQGKIWKPDIELENSITNMKGLGGDHLLINVSSTGFSEWFPYHNFKTKCSVDITYFPFDVQLCVLQFTSWSSSSSDINLVSMRDQIIMDNYKQNGEWEVIDTAAYAASSDVSSIYFAIYLKRRPMFIVLTVIFPLVLLGALSIFVFVLPPESGEKVGFSVTVFLSFAVFLTILKDSLPENATEISYLSIYLVMQMLCGTLCVILTLVQLRLYHRSEDQHVNIVLRAFVSCISKLRCKNNQENKVCCLKPETDLEDELVSKEAMVTWSSVCEALDYVFFWAFLLFQIFLNCYYFFTVTSGQRT